MPLAYFETLLGEMKREKLEIKKLTTTEKSLLNASYLIALQISKTKKKFEIGEELIKPCIVAASKHILCAKSGPKPEDVPLSNDRVQRRIVDMAKDVENQVINGINKSVYFAIQLDDSTDVSNRAILLCFLIYKGEIDLEVEFLCCLDLRGRTTSSEIFRCFDEYFLEHSLDWGKCVGVCTDGAANMTGCRSGVIAKIKEVDHKEMLGTHGIIHREHLTVKKCRLN